MKKLWIILIISLFSISSYAQHIELISEPTDSMALISKEDIDVINNVFNERNILDSLNTINDSIICNLELVRLQHINIIKDQKVIIQNDSLIINRQELLLKERDKILQKYQKDIKNQKTQKTIWMSTSGGLAIALLIVLLI